MKAQRPVRPNIEPLEYKALLSTTVLPHSPAHVAVPAIVGDSTATGVQLYGGLGNGYGGVSPLGAVRGRWNLTVNTLTLSNRRGTLELQLSQIFQHRYTTTARSWQIVAGTGQFASLQGSGPGVFNVVRVGGRVVAWSAAFY
jgi:hypothetical protein